MRDIVGRMRRTGGLGEGIKFEVSPAASRS